MRIIPVFTLALLASTSFAATSAEAEEVYCAKVEKSGWMSEADLKAKYEELGYEVRDIDTEHGCWEIKGFDKDKKRVELYLDPVTGDIVKSKD